MTSDLATEHIADLIGDLLFNHLGTEWATEVERNTVTLSDQPTCENFLITVTRIATLGERS